MRQTFGQGRDEFAAEVGDVGNHAAQTELGVGQGTPERVSDGTRMYREEFATVRAKSIDQGILRGSFGPLMITEGVR